MSHLSSNGGLDTGRGEEEEEIKELDLFSLEKKFALLQAEDAQVMLGLLVGIFLPKRYNH